MRSKIETRREKIISSSCPRSSHVLHAMLLTSTSQPYNIFPISISYSPHHAPHYAPHHAPHYAPHHASYFNLRAF
ncbi:uncharacterized [Tachysurus ichikawai]